MGGSCFRSGCGNVVDSPRGYRLRGENYHERDRRHGETLLDLVVVGGGVAGLYAALCAAREADVLAAREGAARVASNSYLAQGGVAAALGEDDDPALHAEDTLARGRAGSAARARSRVLTEEAPARIADLVDARRRVRRRPRPRGRPLAPPRRPRGRRRDRQGDRARARRARARPSADLGRRGRARRRPLAADGRCVGVVTDRRRRRARARRCSRPAARPRSGSGRRTRAARSATGIALAYRAGAALADLEFVQFHPTALVDSRLPALARRCAARARCSSTSGATASPTSSLRATSSPARSQRAARRCSTCARSTAAASRP